MLSDVVSNRCPRAGDLVDGKTCLALPFYYALLGQLGRTIEAVRLIYLCNYSALLKQLGRTIGAGIALHIA